MIFPYNGTQPSNKKEYAPEKCRNINESQRYYTEQKKSYIKEYIQTLLFLIYEVLKGTKLISDGNHISGCLG